MRNILLTIACTLFVSIPAFAADDVAGKGRVGGYACPDSSDIEHPVNRAKREAVENAESQCDWDGGRPTVRRTAEWTIDTSCETLSSGFRYGIIVAEASFACE